MNTSDFIYNFPFKEIREPQRYILEEFHKGMEEGKRFFVIEAPTGVGKSGIAVALGRTFLQSYIITGTKDLQAQYLRDFPEIKLVKGRNNFPCYWIEEKGQQVMLIGKGYKKPSADDGDCTVHHSDTKCPYFIKKNDFRNGIISEKGRNCAYYEQKYDGYFSPHTIYNYDYFLPQALYSKDFQKRPVLIFDEAHELEDQIVDFLTLKLNFAKLDDILGTDYRTGYEDRITTYSDDMVLQTNIWVKMVEEIYGHLTVFIENTKSELMDLMGGNVSGLDLNGMNADEAEHQQAEQMIEEAKSKTVLEMVKAEEDKRKHGEEVDKEIRKKINNVKYADQMVVLVDKFLTDVIENKAWIVNKFRRDDKNRIMYLEFKPVVVGSVARRIYGSASYIVMMSATILDFEAYCKAVGISPQETKFIQVGSDFPIENRKIHALQLGRLNYETLKNEALVGKIINKVDELMSKHPNEKGIIHTTSKAQAKWLIYGTDNQSGLSPVNRKRLISTTLDEEDQIKREAVIQQHVETKGPTVLVSPSLNTGLDLKDDLARFAIIIKVPWPDLKDRWIEARKKVDPQWYIWQAALKIIQAYGRAVRSKTDHAETYVLDTGFVDFCKRYKRILPKWFTDAVVVYVEE